MWIIIAWNACRMCVHYENGVLNVLQNGFIFRKQQISFFSLLAPRILFFVKWVFARLSRKTFLGLQNFCTKHKQSIFLAHNFLHFRWQTKVIPFWVTPNQLVFVTLAVGVKSLRLLIKGFLGRSSKPARPHMFQYFSPFFASTLFTEALARLENYFRRGVVQM